MVDTWDQEARTGVCLNVPLLLPVRPHLHSLPQPSKHHCKLGFTPSKPKPGGGEHFWLKKNSNKTPSLLLSSENQHWNEPNFLAQPLTATFSWLKQVSILTKAKFWPWGHMYFQTWGKSINSLQKLLTMFDLWPLGSTRADWLCQGLGNQDLVRLTLLKASPVLASGWLACCILHAAF